MEGLNHDGAGETSGFFNSLLGVLANISQPEGMEKQAFLDQWYQMNEVVHAIVTKLDGSISAEHGVGTLKRDLLPGVKDPVALDVMRAIKKTLDPQNILNPGKVI